MFNVVLMTVQERIYELACDVAGGKKPNLTRWGLVYRKGKSAADIQKALRLTYARTKEGEDFYMALAKRINDIVISA